MHHSKTDVDRLYLTKGNGIKAMIQLDLSYKISLIKLYKYIAAIQDLNVQLVKGHEKKSKKLFSVSKCT